MPQRVPLFSLTEDESHLVPPFALLLLAGQLRKQGYRPQINHLKRSEIDIDKIVAEVSGGLLVGFSVLTSDLLVSALLLSRAIKEQYGSEIAVVWGGVHPTLCPEVTLKEDCVDYLIMGEGEVSLIKLADYLRDKKKEPPETIPGLGFKENGKPRFNPRETLTNLEPYAYAWDLIEVERYLLPRFGYQRVLRYMTSRGCPYNCAFCYNTVFNDRTWKGFNTKKTIDDISSLKKIYRIDAIQFDDDYLFGNRKRAQEIIRAVDLPWFAELRVSDITRERIRSFKNLKAIGFFLGAESGSERVLKGLNKEISSQDIIRAVAICRKEGINVLRCAFILYTPIEEYRDLRETVRVIMKIIRRHPFLLIKLKHYTPYPGVELTETLKKKGWREPDSTAGWAQYHRKTPPEKLEVFSGLYLKKAAELEEAVQDSISLYKLFHESGFRGAFLNFTIRPLVLSGDCLFRRGRLKYPAEAFLFRLLSGLKYRLTGKEW
ncbi:MAG: B12-binding domain-containing radical SAM protein [bacterium]